MRPANLPACKGSAGLHNFPVRVSLTTVSLLLTFNDHPPPRARLPQTPVSASHFAPAALDRTIGPPPPASSDDLRNSPTRLPAARTPKAATPVPRPGAARPPPHPKPSSPQSPGQHHRLRGAGGGGSVPCPPRTSPLPRNLALPALTTLPRRGRPSSRRLDGLGGRAAFHQAPPGPRGSAPSAARPPGPAELTPKRRVVPAQGPALTQEGRWRRRSSTCAAHRAEAGTRAPQQQPRQPPSCQHRSGRHRPRAEPEEGGVAWP